jgi:hypothetical protein
MSDRLKRVVVGEDDVGIAVVTGLAVAGCATRSGAVAETRATETPLDLAPRSAEH